MAAKLPFFYGWIVVAVAFVTMGVGINVRTSFSLLFPPILEEFGWARGTVAGAFSFGFLASTLFNPFIGLGMDRWGPRIVIPTGVVLVSAGMALSTLADQLWHFYATLGLLVVGGSIFFSYIGHSMFLPLWFQRRRGLAIGIAFSGVGAGSIVLFPWLQQVIVTLGWREACWSMAALLLVVLLPLNTILQRRRPADIGLFPDGDPDPSSLAPADRLPDVIVDRAWAATEWTLARALATRRYWWVFAGFFANLYVWYAVQIHQTKYLIDIGFSPAKAALALGFVGLMGIGGQIGIGHLSDRIGREWAWSLAAFGYALCYLCLIVLKTWPSDAILVAIVATQGLLGYGFASVFGAVAAELFQGPRFGLIFGTLNIGAGLGAATGPWVTGLIFDRTGSYDLAFVLAVALSLFAVAAIWLAAPRKVRLVAGRARRRQDRDGRPQ